MNYPKTLYRFRPTGNSFNYTLRELYGDLWCTYSSTLNDPFDGVNFAKPEEDVAHYSLSGSGKMLSVTGMKDWGIACFTEKWNSAPMWAHYANNYTGICIGYSTEALFEIIEKLNQRDNPKIKSALLKVKYYDKFPEEFENPFQALRSKTNDWVYEDEWRIITQNFKGNNLPRGNGTIINTLALSSKKAITEIMYGFRTDIATRKILWGLNESIHKEVPIWAVTPNKDKSGLIKEM